MSARIRIFKSNSLKSKNKRIFAKTVTSNFMETSEKSPKIIKEFNKTKTTQFSDNNITRTIASSIRTISKFKLRKKEKPVFINLENFHKEFILNKNRDNRTISSIYTQNGYNSIISRYMSNISSRKNGMKLKKKFFSPSFSSATDVKSRNLLLKNNYNNNENQSNTLLSSFLDKIKNNQNKISYLKEMSKISKNNKTTNTHSNNYSIFNSNLFFSQNFKDIEPIFKKKKSIKNQNNKIYKNSNNNHNFFNTIDNKSIHFNNSNNSNYNIINGDKNITKLYTGHNRLSLNDKLAYPSFNSYLFARVRRYENIPQFIYKTRLMSLDKYIKNIYNNNYNKQLTLNDNSLEKQSMKERHLELMKKIFFSYNKTLDDYIKYLLRKYREMQEENESLKIKIVKIMTDIENIKQKMIKDMTKIKDGYSVKYFLMCVKNHTLFFEKFEKRDIEEIQKDRLKLKESYYFLNSKNKKKENKNNKKNSKIYNEKTKTIKAGSSDKNVIQKKDKIFPKNDNIRNFKKYKSYVSILNKKLIKFDPTTITSIDDFFDHLNAIASKLNNLIKEYSDKCSNNNYLKIQLENIIKNSEEQTKESIYLDNKIKLYESSLVELKSKNKKLLNEINNHKDNNFKNNVKITLVLKNIQRIYINIKKNYINIKSVNKEDVNTYGYQIYLKIIEDFFLIILNKVLEDKKKYCLEYEKLKIQMEKIKKKEAFFLFQRLLAQRIEIKIDSVLQRASKVIHKRLRKTNDYREYYKNNNNFKKDEEKENDMDLFFEFIQD